MSTDNHPRADATLKKLPEERQMAIAEFLSKKGNTLAKAVNWLREDGLDTSTAALSRWLSWFTMRHRAEQREEKIQAWLECEKLEHPELNDEELFRRGQRKFQLLSIAEEDPDAWSKIQKAGRDKEQLALDKSKLEIAACEFFLAWFKDKKAQEIANSTASNADKISQLRLEYFKDVDALQQSGKVVLPE